MPEYFIQISLTWKQEKKKIQNNTKYLQVPGLHTVTL